MQLQVLFELSQASLTKNTNRGDKTEPERKAYSQSLQSVDTLMDKLQNLRQKVRKLDPNQESLNDIKIRMSQSQVGPFGGRGNSRHSMISKSSSRKSIGGVADTSAAGNNRFVMTDGRLDTHESDEMDEGQLAIEGKIFDFLQKLNEILAEYERERVIESAILNYDRFNKLLHDFMDLPEVFALVESVKDEPLKEYHVLDQSTIDKMILLEHKITKN
jgi:hypothetical protein